MNNKKHFNALTFVRFFAAFLVLGFHFFSFDGNLTFLNTAFQRGYLGVDFFFMLSGFILAYNYIEFDFSGAGKMKKFFIARIARIAPLYYLSLGLSLPLLYLAIKKHHLSLGELLQSIPLHLTFLQSYYPSVRIFESWNVPSWSLSVEFFFYVTFPFIMMKFLPFISKKFSAIFFALLSVVSFSILTKVNQSAPTPLIWQWGNFPLIHLPTFLLGVSLHTLYENYHFHLKSNFLLLISLLAGALLLFFPFPGHLLISTSPLVIIPFAIIILSFACNPLINRLSSYKYFLILGEISYGIYILQAPLKLLAQQIYSKVFHLGVTAGPLYAFYITVFIAGGSYFAYFFFEVPMRNKIRNYFK